VANRQTQLPSRLCLGDAVAAALEADQPIVALETTVVTHGLPEPRNLEAARDMERIIRAVGATPATCLVQEGELWIGATLEQIEAVSRHASREKASVRDLGVALASGASAGLTVSATLFAAQLVGIRVFATGGLGGVHHGSSGDVSSDLPQLTRSQVITVCSGAKSVLDIPRTLEYLETWGVPVFSYGAPEFPAFYLRSSGVSARALQTVQEIVDVAVTQWDLGYASGIVVANPIDPGDALEPEDWKSWLEEALQSAHARGIHGKEVTPYLLARVAESSGGRTIDANLALLRQNARLAAEISVALATT
jgi:pseudouridine-5'-phosphate glycosidase